MKKVLSVFALVLVAFLALSGCELLEELLGDDPIVGQWALERVNNDYTPIDMIDTSTEPDTPFQIYSDVFTFYEDGTWSERYDRGTVYTLTGTWEEDDGIYFLDVDASTTNYEYVMSDSEDVLTWSNGNDIWYYHKD